MAIENPFGEPHDVERTLIRPVPSGRAVAKAEDPTERPQSAPPSDVQIPRQAFAIGANPLLAAAAPLLQLLGRLRNTASPPDAGDLRERAVAELRRFEQASRAANVPMEQLRPAHYALCASLDDVVLSTPWGSTGTWASRSLVAIFHKEVRGGERFFDVLADMRQNPGTSLPVLELMYMCLSLGFMGRHRLSQRGSAEIESLREETYAVIVRQKPPHETALSARWQGVDAPYRPRRAPLPVWVAAVAGLALVGAVYVWSTWNLADASDGLFARAMAVPPTRIPEIARATPVPQPVQTTAAPVKGPLDRLRTFLKPEIDQGLVTVLGTNATPIVRIRNPGLFQSGSATLSPRFVPLLERIGAALATEPGRVDVTGHTDNQPIRNVRFPSNFQLSAARAVSAAQVLARTIGDPSRIRTEGRADADPVASNSTPEGQELNRRVEVVLHRQD